MRFIIVVLEADTRGHATSLRESSNRVFDLRAQASADGGNNFTEPRFFVFIVFLS